MYVYLYTTIGMRVLFIVNIVSAHSYNPDNNFANLVFPYRGADKSLARPGRKQATATEDFDVHISYL